MYDCDEEAVTSVYRLTTMHKERGTTRAVITYGLTILVGLVMVTMALTSCECRWGYEDVGPDAGVSDARVVVETDDWQK